MRSYGSWLSSAGRNPGPRRRPAGFRPHAHRVEEQLGGVRRVLADLLQPAPDPKAGAGLRSPSRPATHPCCLRRRATGQHQQRAREALVMKVLAPFDHVVVTVATGARAQRLQVRAASGLGHRDRAQVLAAREFRQPPAPLRIGAVREQVVRDDRMHAGDAGPRRARARPAPRAARRGHPRAAVLFRASRAAGIPSRRTRARPRAARSPGAASRPASARSLLRRSGAPGRESGDVLVHPRMLVKAGQRHEGLLECGAGGRARTRKPSHCG